MRTPNLVGLRLRSWWPALGLVLFLSLLTGADAQEKKERFFKKGPPPEPRSEERASSDQVKQLEAEVARLRAQVRSLSAAHQQTTQGKDEPKGSPHHGMAHQSNWHKHWAHHSERGQSAHGQGQHRWHHGQQYARHHGYHHRHHDGQGHYAWSHHDVQRQLDRIQHDLNELRHSLQER